MATQGNKKKIMLVYPSARDACAPPLGIAYLASYLRMHGHEVRVLDLTAHSLTEEELDKVVSGFGDYDCIGISAIITAYKFVKQFSRKIKSYFPDMPVIVGNLISNSCPETLLTHTDTDVVVVDEGELTTLELIENIDNPAALSKIKGIWYKENGKAYKTQPRERIDDLDKLPYPAWDLLDMKVYMQNSGAYLARGSRTGWISTVRGCPFNCGYCSHGYRQKVTSRSVDSIIKEIRELKARFNINHINLIDDLFLPNTEMREEFCNRLISERFKITWECAGRVNLVNDRLLKLMKKSGCVNIGYGIESGSQKILDNMNKCVKVPQAESAIRMTRKNKIRASTSFIIGYVGETKETIRESVDFIQRLALPDRRFFFATPYPGTDLYEWARKDNRIKHDEDTYLSMLGNNAEVFLVNLTDFPDEELVKLKNEAEAFLSKSMPLRLRLQGAMARMCYLKNRFKSYGIVGSLKKISLKLNRKEVLLKS